MSQAAYRDDLVANSTDIGGLVLATDLRPVFQPIVDLVTGEAVGYEALARGPRGSAHEMPDALFAAAREQRRVAELDWACRWAAVDAARRAGLRHPLALFVNAEPEALGGPPGEGTDRWREMGDLRCFAEITERALTERPAELLRMADLVRSQDWGIALDDVGANPQTVALMPMLQPDVLKLDLRLLREHDTLEAAQVTHAVLSQAAETGATVIAEGIEDERQNELALALGARLGQGWLHGRPGPLPEALPHPSVPVALLPRLNDRAVTTSPYAVVNDTIAARIASRDTVETLWRQIERQVAVLQPAPIVLASFPEEESYVAAAPRFAAMRAAVPLVASFVPPRVRQRHSGLRTAELDHGDPATADWNLVVIGPTYCAALVARPLPETPDSPPRCQFVLTFSRPLVVRAANAFLMRL